MAELDACAAGLEERTFLLHAQLLQLSSWVSTGLCPSHTHIHTPGQSEGDTAALLVHDPHDRDGFSAAPNLYLKSFFKELVFTPHLFAVIYRCNLS